MNKLERREYIPEPFEVEEMSKEQRERLILAMSEVEKDLIKTVIGPVTQKKNEHE